MTTGDGGLTITAREDWAERMFLFRDKGWTRKPGWGARTYACLAPNYRMTELQGAVGLAQIKKVRGVVEKRMELGNRLTELIADVAGLTPAPVTQGSEHSYWSYPLHVDGWPTDGFATALKREGIAVGLGYIGLPIFLCMEALASKKTFGNSTHPFDGCHGGRTIEYTEGMCPRTEQLLQQMINIGFNENFTVKDIEDISGAIRKVAELLEKE